MNHVIKIPAADTGKEPDALARRADLRAELQRRMADGQTPLEGEAVFADLRQRYQQRFAG